MIPELQALGHRAAAAVCRARILRPCSTTIEARAVAGAMAGIDERPVVIVGRSAGGATIALVPGLAPVDRLVYGTAVVPDLGRSLSGAPCSYVLCSRDKIIPQARQRAMATRLGVEPIAIAAEHAVFAQ